MTAWEIPVDDERALLALCADGARSASEALARFLDADAATVEGPERVSVSELERRVGPGVTAVGFRLSGGFEGALVHLLSPRDRDALLERLPLSRSHSGAAAAERARGALSEAGNIAASAFLNAVATRVRRACLPSVPRLSKGGVAAALERVDVDVEHPGVLLVCARVRIEGSPEVTLSLVIVPDAVSTTGLAVSPL